MKAVIMAGGKGTRISAVYPDIPKPMIPLGGKPVILRQVECLAAQGVKDFIFVTGHLGHKIEEYFADGAKFGVKIEYIREDAPLGTAGALYYLKGKIQEDALLIFGDIFFDIDVKRFTDFHKSKAAGITLFTHPNSHPYDSDLVVADERGRVTAWDSKNNSRNYDYDNLVNAGLYVISPSFLKLIKSPVKADLEKDVIMPLVNAGGKVYSYRSTEYVKDAGTPERLSAVERDFKSGVTAVKNLKNPQACIFLDRDGVLNKHTGFINKPEQIELIPGVAEAVGKINSSKYLAIVITNQPVVARGECTFSELDAVHKCLSTLLGREGAYLDGLYFCPHHPDKGFPNEVPSLKTDCGCRKPKTGLFVKAAAEHNISPALSFMAGDSDSDIKAGRAFGVKTVAIGNAVTEPADFYADNLHEAVDIILSDLS